MKNLKNYFVLTFITLLTSVLFFACSNEQITEDKINNKKSNTASKILGTGCSYINDNNPAFITLTPTTLSNLCAPNAQAVVVAGSSGSYKFIINEALSSGNWSVYSGIGITFNSGTSTATGTTVTVNFASSFVSGSIQVIGNDTTGQTYGPILNFTRSGSSNGTDCDCPNPVISPRNATSGGKPYWRFQLENLQAGDTFVWSQLHAPFMGGTNISYVIANPQGPIYSGFTIYCEVTRHCSNGTVKKRKAFYTNYYGGNLQSGTSGFVGNCITTGGNSNNPINLE